MKFNLILGALMLLFVSCTKRVEYTTYEYMIYPGNKVEEKVHNCYIDDSRLSYQRKAQDEWSSVHCGANICSCRTEKILPEEEKKEEKVKLGI